MYIIIIIMTVVPTLERKQWILSTAFKLLTGSSSTVRELAQFIGQVVSCFQGVKFGPLWYRYMENDKIKALKQNKGDYESKVVFSNEAKSDRKYHVVFQWSSLRS